MFDLMSKIEREIIEKAFVSFGAEDWKGGLKVLRKLYFQYYNNINDLEIKRLIVFNMALAEHQIKAKSENAKKYIKLIKDEIENDDNFKEYRESHEVEYSRVLSIYLEIFIDNITPEEYKKVNIENARCYRSCNQMGDYYISLANAYSVDKNYIKILRLMRKTLTIDKKVSYSLKELLSCIDENSSLHKDGLAIIEKYNKMVSSL